MVQQVGVMQRVWEENWGDAEAIERRVVWCRGCGEGVGVVQMVGEE